MRAAALIGGLAFLLASCGGAAAPAARGASATTEPTATPAWTPAQFQITPSPPPPTPPPSPRPSPSPSGPPRPIVHVALGLSDPNAPSAPGVIDGRPGAWPARIFAKLPGGSRTVDLGTPDALAAQVQTPILARVAAERPDVVTLWIGVNDAGAKVDPSRYASTLAVILDALVRDTQALVFVATVPDLRGVAAYAGEPPAVLAARVDAYNAALDLLARRHLGRVFLVDLAPRAGEIVGGATVAAGSFRPSAQAHVGIAQLLSAAMRDRGLPLGP